MAAAKKPKQYWLVKSEPVKYSWDEFVKDGWTYWDGVRNYQARNNLKAMRKGDRVLYYHSNEGTEVVGVARVIKEAYQDPTTARRALGGSRSQARPPTQEARDTDRRQK